ncbi:malonyl-CoA decarboxylase [Zoogloeaceae bacterium G21618-S1]|nr:malonyl-CoA decarboxylase [Zoogloeaceae bacterium G21618-S1]
MSATLPASPTRRDASALPFWRRMLAHASFPRKAGHKAPTERDWKAIEHLLADAARGGDGEAVARDRMLRLLDFHALADDAGKRRLFKHLNDAYSPDATRVGQAIERYLSATDTHARSLAETDLRDALDTPRIQILSQCNLLPDGVHALVRLRADLIRLDPRGEHFAALERDLVRLFHDWFDVGFLALKRIGWGSPAALLEKLIQYEAVHEIKSWTDLRNRLDSDRRCYAFFHPRMENEPLIFVEVALLENIADSVQALLDESQPTLDPTTATVAVFYSISNAQAGLKGVSLGEFLIKRVVEQLMSEYPRLRTFVTLSPVPGFTRALARTLDTEDGVARIPAKLAPLVQGATDGQGRIDAAIAAAQSTPNAAVKQELQRWLTGECARYLLTDKRGKHPLDPVARFHFANGASLAKIHWMADTSARGLRQSAGLMVNYLYRLDEIDTNHDAYARDGALAASAEVKRQLGRKNGAAKR